VRWLVLEDGNIDFGGVNIWRRLPWKFVSFGASISGWQYGSVNEGSMNILHFSDHIKLLV